MESDQFKIDLTPLIKVGGKILSLRI